MAQKDTKYQEYLRNGKEIFETYCSTGDKRPIMLPRAPQQTYIDVIDPNEDTPGCSFQNDRNQQFNYEAEVKVYRVLEKLDGNYIVLHSFEYTHFQYHLGDSNHDRRKCIICKKTATNREGECDFIVIAPTYFVIIEVKNMSDIGEISENGSNKDQQMQALAKTFKKSVEQRKKIKDLIMRFCKRLTVRYFTVYPNFDKAFKSQFQISSSDKSTIIFKDDIDDFSNWWKENVSELLMDEHLLPEFRTLHEKVRNLFLAIWCTDKNHYDIAKCSLGQCILKVDEQLRSGKFIFRQNNPEVIPTPSLYKDFLGVENLTKQQYDLINSTERFLWVNGPAGSGKTVVLMARILKLALSSESNKIFLINGGKMVSAHEGLEQMKDRTLEKAGIKHVIMIPNPSMYRLYTITSVEPTHFCAHIINLLLENQVVIYSVLSKNHDSSDMAYGGRSKSYNDWLDDVFGLLRGINVFVDDSQMALNISDNTHHFVDTLIDLSKSSYICVVCDMAQLYYYVNTLFDYSNGVNAVLAPFFVDSSSSSHQIVSITKNLRNTINISRCLAVIRKQIIDIRSYSPNFLTQLLPLQSPGHYIHGPKVVIHVLENFNKELLHTILAKELDQFLSDHYFPIHVGNTDTLAIMCDPFREVIPNDPIGKIRKDTLSSVNNIIDDVLKSIDMFPWLLKDPFKMESPAVIALQTMEECGAIEVLKGVAEEYVGFSRDLEALYYFISRARVKCTVILIPMKGFVLDNFSRTKDFLLKLESFAEVRRHPLTPPGYKPTCFIDVKPGLYADIYQEIVP